MGFEPTTPALQTRCSSQLSYVPGKPVRLYSAIPHAVRHMDTFAPYHQGMTDGLETASTTPAFEAFAALAKDRRTNLRIDADRPVDPAVITELCVLATWAPNHRLTEPWRFAVLTGDHRVELGARTAAYQAELGETVEARLNKTRTKYTRSPVLVAVGCAFDEDAEVHIENRDAVSAGIQNMLLGATTLGLASYWGSGLVNHSPAVKELCGLDAKDELLGVIYLGWPTSTMPSPGRSAPIIRWL
jgi:nitroreductase